MLRKIKRNSSGFTIVETLIVLAIAGLIILIVLLAVPALQRNSRNTNAKSDASALVGGINEYESNNDGSLPPNVVGAGTFPNTAGVITFCNATGAGTTCPATPTDVPSTAKVQGSDVVKAQTTIPTTMTSGTFIVVPKTECSDTTGGASPRSVAVYYPVEEGSGKIANASNNTCVQA